MSIFDFNYNKSKDHHEFDNQYNKVKLSITFNLKKKHTNTYKCFLICIYPAI